MPFTVEDGTGLANANSYATVAHFRDYLTLRGRSGVDAGSIADEAVEHLLVLATDYIEARWAHRFRGQRSTSEQRLSWPRTQAYDELGNKIGEESVPQKVADACVEYAWRQNTAELQPDPSTDSSGRIATRTREKVGPIEEENEFSLSVAINKPYPAADDLLRSLVTSAGGTIRA